MTSDEPGEDADSLDDDKLLAEFLDASQSVTSQTATSGPHDWPCGHGGREALTVDAEILAWFKTNHEDWQRQIDCVLRAWIATRPGANP